jgi:Na+/phosphate symporter
MLIAIVPVLVLLAGLLTYALAANPRAQEFGRIAFFVGLFFVVAAVAGHTVRLL